tara:strand:+ start:142 stop:609 length:468 start_codon:yes stop_codon:yes gene_type:complete
MSNALTQTLFGNELFTTMSLENAINLLLSKNLINVGELAEQAISKKSGVAMCGKNTSNIDLVSGVQVKYSTVTKPASLDRYLAYIGINTTAPILCVITNPVLNNKQYYLHIPYRAFRHLRGNCINISFGKDGEPRPSQWWHYQVDSFDELCELAK